MSDKSLDAASHRQGDVIEDHFSPNNKAMEGAECLATKPVDNHAREEASKKRNGELGYLQDDDMGRSPMNRNSTSMPYNTQKDECNHTEVGIEVEDGKNTLDVKFRNHRRQSGHHRKGTSNDSDDDSNVEMVEVHFDRPERTLHLLPVKELVKLHSKKTLRFSASDVAAMAGFHPYKNLPQLLQRLVYQSRTGSLLLQRDAQALGLSLMDSEEEIWKSLAAQAGPNTKKAFQKAMTEGATKTVQEATALKKEVVKHAKASGKLNEQEMKVLSDGAQQTVNTRFGNYHEDNALDQIEQKLGWEIFDRNCEIREWPFRRVLSNKTSEATVEPIDKAKVCWKVPSLSAEVETIMQQVTAEIDSCQTTSAGAERKQEISTRSIRKNSAEIIDLVNEDQDKSSNNSPAATKQETNRCGEDGESRPYLVIRGSVDGIREELAPALHSDHKDDGSWAMMPVVVELKHRMNRIFHVPPLYEQIQAVTYCFMYGVNDADIVQVIRHETGLKNSSRRKLQAQNTNLNKNKENQETSTKSEGENVTSAQTSILDHFTPAVSSTSAGNQSDQHCKKKKDAVQDACTSIVTTDPSITDAAIENLPTVEIHSLEKQTVHEDSESQRPIDHSVATDSAVKTSAESLPNPGLHLGMVPNSRTEGEESTAVIDEVKEEGQPGQERPKRREPSSRELSIQADRISLDDPMMQHRVSWENVILPRLCSFADTVYAIRKDDTKRYRLLLALSDRLGRQENDAWELLHELSPWLKNCDTAFNRS